MDRTYLVNFNGAAKPVRTSGGFDIGKKVDYVQSSIQKDGRCWFRAFMQRPTRDKVFYYFTIWESWEV